MFSLAKIISSPPVNGIDPVPTHFICLRDKCPSVPNNVHIVDSQIQPGVLSC